MTNRISFLLSLFALLGLAVTLIAQSTGASGILQPQMTVEKGTYQQPYGKMGSQPAQAWSATTIGAAVNGKPNPGAIRTVVGEIVDLSCYLSIGKHGEAHRDCAQKCFRAGQPVGLLTENGDLFLLMEEEHDPRRDGQGNFRDAAIASAGHIVAVTGAATTVRGFNALYVHGYIGK